MGDFRATPGLGAGWAPSPTLPLVGAEAEAWVWGWVGSSQQAGERGRWPSRARRLLAGLFAEQSRVPQLSPRPTSPTPGWRRPAESSQPWV